MRLNSPDTFSAVNDDNSVHYDTCLVSKPMPLTFNMIQEGIFKIL